MAACRSNANAGHSLNSIEKSDKDEWLSIFMRRPIEPGVLLVNYRSCLFPLPT
jgi:hypothetical protein